MNEQNYWSQYWKQGHKTSFGDSFADLYKGALAQEWQHTFQGFKSSRNVLDLCTGNASLLRLAQKSCANFEQINFTGVDYAQLKTDDNFELLDNISLKFKVNIEKLPFSKASFDAVISNYGIEYSNLDKSIPEVGRVLKSGGQLNLICHSTDSILIKENQEELNLVSAILEKNGALERLTELIQSLQIVNNNENSEQCRNGLNKTIESLHKKFGNALYNSEFIKFLKYVLKLAKDEQLNAISAYATELTGFEIRLKSMVESAISGIKLSKIKALLEGDLFVGINSKPLYSDGNIIAIAISAIKKTD